MLQSNANTQTSPNARATDKPKRQYRTHNQWREIVHAFEHGDLTRAAFCQRHGIAISGLYNWQRKFEQENVLPSRNTEAFVEVQAPATPASLSSQAWDVELELGHGRVLRVRIA